MILTNARILTLDPRNTILDNGSVEVRADGTIGAVGPCKAAGTSQEGIDCHGRLLMPALINCHTHLYSTLARGLRIPGPAPKTFPQILQKVWWKFDRALTRDDVYYSALVGLIDSAKNGVGTVIDHHSSPKACAGSLDAIAQAFHKVGLRGALCYETSDRNGPRQTQDAIRENVRFLERSRGDTLLAGAFGLHAAFTLSDRTLRSCMEANQSLNAGFHIHVAEDSCDVGAVRRLRDAGILDQRTLAAHCVHISAADRRTIARLGVNVVHNPQSNCNNRVGTANLFELFRKDVLVGMGSDGYSPRMWDELKTALHLQARKPATAGTAFLNNRTIVKKVFGMEIGRIETGARADLVLIDYVPPTPMNGDNLFGHILFGISNAPVDSLMVNGAWVMKDKHCVNVDEQRIADWARVLAAKLFERIL